jgi:hypothetical protein
MIVIRQCSLIRSVEKKALSSEWRAKSRESRQHDTLQYLYVLSENWFCSAENMICIELGLNREFIVAIKANRTLALSLKDKQQGRYASV